MSVRHAVQHTQFPVEEEDNPSEQTVPKAEICEDATCDTQQPGATAEHQPPSRSTCSKTIRTNFVSQPGVRTSDFVVSAGTDIVPIEGWRRTGDEADQPPY